MTRRGQPPIQFQQWARAISLQARLPCCGSIVIADGIDLAVSAGEALGIIGPNGAGKTTLFGIASGAVAPDAGRVLLDGRDITRLPPEKRCRLGIARSFQIPQPFVGMTVFENLAVAAAFGQGRRERVAACFHRHAATITHIQFTAVHRSELKDSRSHR